MTWRTVALGEHVASRTGSVIPSNFPDEEFELYSIPAHDAGGPEFTQGVEIGSAKQNVQPGDVLLAKIIPHIRRVRVVGESSGRRQVASGEWIIFRTGDYEPNYLRHFLLSDRFHVQFMNTVAGVGGSLVRARPEFVKKIQAPLPPLDEQRRIADILDDLRLHAHRLAVAGGRRVETRPRLVSLRDAVMGAERQPERLAGHFAQEAQMRLARACATAGAATTMPQAPPGAGSAMRGSGTAPSSNGDGPAFLAFFFNCPPSTVMKLGQKPLTQE